MKNLINHIYSLRLLIIILFSLPASSFAQNQDFDRLLDRALAIYDNAKVSITSSSSNLLYKEALALFEELLDMPEISDQDKSNILINVINCKVEIFKTFSYRTGTLDIVKDLNKLIKSSKDNQEYINNLLLSSKVCAQFNDINQALLFYNEAKAIKSKYYIHDKELEIDLLETLGLIEFNNYRELKGIRHLTAASKMVKEMYGPYSNEYLLRLLELSSKYASINRFSKSSNLHAKAHKPYIESVRKQFSQLSESQRAKYWGNAHQYFSKTNSIAFDFTKGHSLKHSISSTAYDCNLISKSILLTTSKEYDNYISMQSDSIIIDLSKKMSLESGDRADSLNLKIIERLNELGISYRSPHLDINWKDVKKGLQADDLAIEFFKINSCYGALLLKKHWRHPKCVILGEIEINTKSAKTSITERWKLSKKIWTDDILRHFPRNPKANIYFAPDAEMYLYSIEYLPLFEENSENPENSISDYFNIHRVSSTRTLATQKNTIQDIRSASLYGAAAFTLPQRKIKEINNEYDLNKSNFYSFRDIEYENALLKGEVSDYSIASLPNTLHEINKIEEHFKSGALTPSVITGGYFNEHIFRNSHQGKDIIHIATHGYYLPNIKDSDNSISSDPMERNALILSGGASTIWFTQTLHDNDGLMTANEIASLDMTKAKLVIMSACESGSGALGADGIWGLQRGFKKAGANSIIMSLWKVDDEACYRLFDKFYQYLLIEKKDVRQSFISAQKDLRNDPKFESVNHWASFILID